MRFLKLAIFLIIALIIYYFYNLRSIVHPRNVHLEAPQSTVPLPQTTEKISFKRNDIVLAVVACGDRLRETLNVLKSALMFSKDKLNFIVVAEDNLIPSFNEKLSEWRQFTNSGFTYTVMPLTFPSENTEEWKKLFKPCASQRLFLPNVLQDVDSLLYVDTDVLLLTPIETIWRYFRKMNSSHIAALAPESESPNDSWYFRFAKHPYYPPLGVNSGVMLMNLTRMRQFRWDEYVVPIYKKFKLKITWGDQDIINIIFHYHRNKLYLYSCRFNYRPDHCMYMSVCKDAEKNGVAVIHGSRGFFHSEKQPVFKAIYRAFDEFRLGGDIQKDFYQPLETYLELAKNSNCGHVKDIFLKNLKLYLDFDYGNL